MIKPTKITIKPILMNLLNNQNFFTKIERHVHIPITKYPMTNNSTKKQIFLHWGFIKGQIHFHAFTDIWTDTQMHNYTHSLSPTSLYKYLKLKLQKTIQPSRASSK